MTKKVSSRVTIKPGLTANGQPTSNADNSVDRSLISSSDDWGYIVEIYSAYTSVIIPTITVNDVTNDNIINIVESNQVVSITGSTTDIDDGDTVTITVANTNYQGSISSGAFNIPVSGSVLAMTDTLTASVVTTIQGEQVTAEFTKTYLVDVEAPLPTISVDTIAGDDIIDLVEAANTVTITGTTSNTTVGDTVTLTVNSTEYTGTVDNNGDYSIVVSGNDLAIAANSVLTASVSTTDSSGNIGTAEVQKTYTVFEGSEFSPLSLFSTGEEGAWYDPSPTTAFLSITDLTPCNVGEACGFLLDKSKGAGYSDGSFTGLGSEVVTNTGNPFTTTDGYTITLGGGTLTVVNGSLEFSPVDSGRIVTTLSNLNVGATYILNFVQSGAATVRVTTVSSGSGGDSVVSGQAFVATATTMYLVFVENGGQTTIIDSVSVRELPGNHAVQSVLADRPILRQSGSIYYLEFDGVGDYMAAPTPAIDLTNLTMAGAFEQLDNANFAGFINLAPATGNDYQTQANFFMDSSGNNDGIYANLAATAYAALLRLGVGSYLTATELGVYLAQKTSTTSFLNKNGVQVSTGNTFNSAVNTAHTGDLILGARFVSSAPTLYANMNFYGCVIVDRAIDATEIDNTEIYLADRSGVTLAEPFTPASLFTSSEQGAWYDPSDLTTVWSDLEGTTQTVPALEGATPLPENTVARIDDKSGNGNHATQSVSSSRPILRQNGSLYYLEFDGTDDGLITNSVDFSGGDEAYIFVGIKKLADGVAKTVVVLSNSINNNGTFGIAYPRNSTVTSPQMISRGTVGRQASSLSSFPAPRTSVLRGHAKISSDVCEIYENGLLLASESQDQGSGNYGNYPLYIMDYPSVNNDGYLYSLIIRGAASTAQEISDTETYIADKTGVTL